MTNLCEKIIVLHNQIKNYADFNATFCSMKIKRATQ